MTNLDSLVNELSSMTLLEASQLSKMLREKWGITETVSPIMRSPSDVVTQIEKAVEQELFNVVLRDIGPKKIEVIKVVRQLTNLGLKDAKDLTETKNAVVLESIDRERSKLAKDALVGAGAVVELV